MGLYDELSVHLDAIGELASTYDDQFPMPADVSDKEARLNYLVGILHAADTVVEHMARELAGMFYPLKPYSATLAQVEEYEALMVVYRAQVEALKQAKREAEAARRLIADQIQPLLPDRIWVKVGDWFIGTNGAVQLCTNGTPWPL
jgi:hypothetical protein